ncbi:hypothetical protein VM1G_04881 [Cytospora mali]|uniref:Uncharacterized protein n=1 Tax=Cytospora mali TaxID=578113 RepID=A0A194VZE2_CYTMA|nr:hypothetical protein VM1G_04881 [Valsa mali]
MSQPGEGEGKEEEPHVTPSNPQNVAGSQARTASITTPAPTRQPQQTPGEARTFRRTGRNFTPSTGSGRTAPPSRRTILNPFIAEEAEEGGSGPGPGTAGGTGGTARRRHTRNVLPTPTRVGGPVRRSISFDFTIPSAYTPVHYPDETKTRAPSILRSSTAPRLSGDHGVGGSSGGGGGGGTPTSAPPAWNPSASRAAPSTPTTARALAPLPALVSVPAFVPASASAAAVNALQPRQQPATPQSARINLNPFSMIRDWWAPRNRTTAEQRPTANPTGQGEEGAAGHSSPTQTAEDDDDYFLQALADPQSQTTQRAWVHEPEAHSLGDKPWGTSYFDEWAPKDGWHDGGQAEAQPGSGDCDDGSHPDAGESDLSSIWQDAESSASQQSGSSSPWRTSARGQDDYNFDDVNFKSGIRAKAFNKVLKRGQTERIFQKTKLFYKALYHARTREPKIDLEVLDDMINRGTKTIREWLGANGQDIPQELQDKIVDKVIGVLGGMRDDIGTLLVEEKSYVKDFAENLEHLLTRSPGRPRSLTSGASSVRSIPLPKRDLEPLDRGKMSILSKETLLDFLFERDGQRADHINNLQDVCETYEANIVKLEEEIQSLEATSFQQRSTEPYNFSDVLDSLLYQFNSEESASMRDTASQPSNGSNGTTRDRLLTFATASYAKSPKSAGSRPGSASAFMAQSEREPPPEPIEIMDQPAIDPIRRQLLEGLQDIWRCREVEDELTQRYMRKLARGANIAIRPGLEEGNRLSLASANFINAKSTTPEQLKKRLRRVTLERDRARKAENTAQFQLNSRPASHQRSDTAPAGLIRRATNVFGGVRWPNTATVASPATATPPTAPLNHPSMVRLLRVVSQLVDELSGCSSATSNLAQTMARCGRMDTDQSPILPALNNLRAVIRMVRTDKPETPTENDLAGGNETWRALYLDEIEGYTMHVRRRVVGAINTLDSHVDQWDRINQQDSDNSFGQTPVPQLSGDARSRAERSEAESMNDLVGGPTGEQGVEVDPRPLITGGWLAAHPTGPCDLCTPVLQIPEFAAELREATCECAYGTGVMVEERAEGATKSRGSSRSVTFADERPGILKGRRRRRRPSQLDLSAAKSHRSTPSTEGGNRPSTPHPLKSIGDRGSDHPEMEREPPTSHARRGCGCNCPCRKGVRVAYYMCRNMVGQLADGEASQAQTELQAADDTQQDPEEPRSVERWILDVASDVVSMVAWGSPRTNRSSSRSAVQDPSQIPLPPSSVASSQTLFLSVPSARLSPHNPPPLTQSPLRQNQTSSPRRSLVLPDTPGRRRRRATAPANIATLLGRLPRVLEAESESHGVPADPGPADREPSDGQPAEAQSRDGQPDDQPDNLKPGNQQRSAEATSEPAPVPEPVPGRPTFWASLADDPLLAMLTLLWDILIFFTLRQLRNISVILWFILSALWYYVQLPLYVVLRFLARQNVVPPQAPMLPRFELSSLFAWVALVWISTMAIALNEERRIWRNANPLIARGYVRGMPYRRLYPWWSLYLVDTDLVEPALGGLSEMLHELILSSDDSNLTSMFFE